MSQQISLKEFERNAFRATHSDGLWDIFLGCFFLGFVIALYLGPSLGDFWSSVVLLPFWALVYLAIWLVRKYVVLPRIGRVKFGQVRKTKLGKFIVIMLAFNIVAMILGIIAFISIGKISGEVISIIFGLSLLSGFSLAAFFLDFSRLYIYGLLAGISPLLGEWLWANGVATHHGFPITFGSLAGIMILVGLTVFLRLLRDNPLPTEGLPS